MSDEKISWKRGIIWTLITALFLSAILIYQSYKKPADQLEVYFFDVGQGDSALIQKGDQQILIDGGPDDKVLAELGKVMPLWDRKIETVILTHPHADHITGINQVISRYQIGKIYFNGTVSGTDQYLNFLNQIKKDKIAASVPKIGDNFELFPDAKLTFLWPGEKYEKITPTDMNDSSEVANFCYLSKCLLLTGDIQTDEQDEMLDYYSKINQLDLLKSQIIKVAHHGSRNGSSMKLYEVVQPKTAVISVGKGNQFGHPHKETLDILNSLAIQILRTDQEGTIKFVFTDGNWVEK